MKTSKTNLKIQLSARRARTQTFALRVSVILRSAARLVGIAIVIFLICATHDEALAALIGTSRAQTFLYDIDENTGLASIRVDTGFSQITGLALMPTGPNKGKHYASTFAGAILEIDINSGVLTFLANTGHTIGGLAFDPDGKLFLLGGAGILLTYDLSSRAVTEVGTIAFPSLVGDLAFDASGNLFVAALEQSGIDTLLRIDPTDASVLRSTPFSITIGNIVGMTFDPIRKRILLADGGFEGTDSLYELDALTVSLNLIGHTGLLNGIDALAPVSIPTPFTAQVQPPINEDGTSSFSVKRGVVPVKFTLAIEGEPICNPPPATICVSRIAEANRAPISESDYNMAADNGSDFRIDDCQYIYNLSASALGVGKYLVEIKVDDEVVGSAEFDLK